MLSSWNESKYLGDGVEYLERLLHVTPGPGEGAEYEDARVLLGLTRRELLGHEVHSVPERRDEAHPGVSVECRQLVLGHAPENVPDRGRIITLIFGDNTTNLIGDQAGVEN